jgi:hypothetical protein
MVAQSDILPSPDGQQVNHVPRRVGTLHAIVREIPGIGMVIDRVIVACLPIGPLL